jgi:hypothetical protein
MVRAKSIQAPARARASFVDAPVCELPYLDGRTMMFLTPRRRINSLSLERRESLPAAS